jgi:predicted nucleotide-binding protein (sugar kinase/HSP70/actin superfamily)
MNKFGDDRRYVSGNKCEKGAGRTPPKDLPNLMRYKYEYITGLPVYGGTRAKIGLPLALNMYENLPFWAEFFRTLGCEVVLSGESSRALYLKGQGTIPSDTVCYPAKLVHGHIEALVQKGVTHIFYPCMTDNFDEGVSENCYNCPVVAYYPELIRANMPEHTHINFISPHISLNNASMFISKAFDLFREIIPELGFGEVVRAAESAYAAYRKYMASLIAEGERALKWAEEHAAKVVVLASRPYHADPEVNHGIDRLLTSLGFVILTEDSIPRETKPDVNILNQWTYHARMYNAAAFVAETDDVEMVQLVSFGCGLDAVTTDEIRDILREKGKLYSMLKIDEINNLGAAKIRMRSLLAAMEERSRKMGGLRIAR